MVMCDAQPLIKSVFRVRSASNLREWHATFLTLSAVDVRIVLPTVTTKTPSLLHLRRSWAKKNSEWTLYEHSAFCHSLFARVGLLYEIARRYSQDWFRHSEMFFYGLRVPTHWNRKLRRTPGSPLHSRLLLDAGDFINLAEQGGKRWFANWMGLKTVVGG